MPKTEKDKLKETKKKAADKKIAAKKIAAKIAADKKIAAKKIAAKKAADKKAAAKKAAAEKAAKKAAEKEEASSLDHILTPPHEKLSEEEIDYVIKTYNLNKAQLPAINIGDPAIKSISVQSGDVVKITRISPTSGETYYYRMVIGD